VGDETDRVPGRKRRTADEVVKREFAVMAFGLEFATERKWFGRSNRTGDMFRPTKGRGVKRIFWAINFWVSREAGRRFEKRRA